MTRKKNRRIKQLQAEAIVWDDVWKHERNPIDEEENLLITAGFVAYEDDKVVKLMQECEFHELALERAVDFTSIRKSLIVKRIKLGTVVLDDDETSAASDSASGSSTQPKPSGHPLQEKG